MQKKTKYRLAAAALGVTIVGAGALTAAYAEGTGGSQSGTSISSSSSWMSSDSLNTNAPVSNVASTLSSSSKKSTNEAMISTTLGGLSKGNLLVANSGSTSSATITEINTTTHKSWNFTTVNASSLGSCSSSMVNLTSITVLSAGWVVAADIPTSSSNMQTAQAGCLVLMNSWGHVAAIISGHGINGPTALAVVDQGNFVELFVANAMSGNVTRIDLSVSRMNGAKLLSVTVIASHLTHQVTTTTIIAQSGMTMMGNTLFIVDTMGNRVIEIANATTRWSTAGTGTTLASGGMLSAPSAIAVLNNGVLVVTNGNGDLIAVTTQGQVAILKTASSTSATTTTPTVTGTGALTSIVASTTGTSVFIVNASTGNVIVVVILPSGSTSTGTTTTTPAPTPTATNTNTSSSGSFTGHF